MSEDTNKIHLTIVWNDASKLPLKEMVECAYPEGAFLYVELPADLLPPGAKHKSLLFPASEISSVQIVEFEDQTKGYREESTFREQPDKNKWFGGMGQVKNVGGDEVG